jgi:hypothetical protein
MDTNYEYEVKRVMNLFAEVRFTVVQSKGFDSFGGDHHWLSEDTAQAARILYQEGLVQHGASTKDVLDLIDQHFDAICMKRFAEIMAST